MNIFITHKDPLEAATFLYSKDKRRATKMIIEGIQIISTYISLNDENTNWLYKEISCPPFKPLFRTNLYPLKWCLKDKNNIAWLITYLKDLCHLRCINNDKPMRFKHNLYQNETICEFVNRLKLIIEGYNLSHSESIPDCLCKQTKIYSETNNKNVYESYIQILYNKWNISDICAI